MNEQNNPVDIGKEQLAKFKSSIEEILTTFRFGGKQYSLPDLLLKLDPEEEYVMSNLERDTYLALREGMQVFSAATDLLAEKIGLKQLLISTPSSDLSANPELNRLRSFCHNYATFAASLFIAQKMDAIIRAEGVEASEKKPDASDMPLSLDSAQPEKAVIRRLLAPVYAYLVKQMETGKEFESPLAFAVCVKDMFAKYVELAQQAKDAHPELDRHLQGYQFRILDEFLVLEAYENKSVSTTSAAAQAITFTPIRPQEIVGNRNAKRKIIRYVQRLALYDPIKQMNPILDLGGLAWTSMYDGLPGTGKSSLFRLAMTQLKELSDQVGFKFAIFTVDQSIKDEYYGKTGKILLQRLSVTQNPALVSLGILDDIDLLTSSRDDAQGADNDINNILMQYLDGAFTVRRGNVINFAASNKPTGLDDALRNRFNDRVLIDGPSTAEDFADICLILAGKMFEKNLVKIEKGYEPFSTQFSPEHLEKEDVAGYMADEFTKYKKATLLDFGKFVAELKAKNPKITGRSSRAIIEAIKERSADFDLPPEWFANRAIFFDQPYEKKIGLLTELYQPITPDILFQEAQRYFDSEARFADTEAEGHVTRGYNNLMWDVQAQIRYYQEQVANGERAEIGKLDMLKAMARQLVQQHEATIRKALGAA